MTDETRLAYEAWRRAAEKGYGNTTTRTAMIRIDRRIRRLKETYERMLAAERRAPK